MPCRCRKIICTFKSVHCRSLEAAAMICRDNKQALRGVELIERASLLYLEHGTPDTAAMALERAAK